MKMTIKIRIVLFLSFNLIVFYSGVAQNEIGKKYLDDFKMLVTNLRELHPLLYTNISKEEFDKNVGVVSARLVETESRTKAIYIIQEFVCKLGNGHAGNISIYQGDWGVTKCIPFSVYIIDKEIYINDYPADTTFNGVKIKSIENSPSIAILDSLKILFPTDGNRDIVSNFLQPYFNTYYAAFCYQKDTFLVETEKGLLRALACTKESELYNKLIIKKSWKDYFGEKSFICQANPDYGYYRSERFNNRSQEKEFYSLIKELNEKKINNLVIDLRYNNGGEALMTGNMVSYLKTKSFKIFENIYTTDIKRPTYFSRMDNKSHFRFRNLRTKKEAELRKMVRWEKSLKEIQPPKDAYKGQVYVLTSSITLSASAMFCAYLQNEPQVTFIGTETSGATNYLWASNFCTVHYPNLNTVFSFGIELLEVKKNSSNTEKPIGLIPANKISYSIQDRLNKKDKEMDWIKAAILKSSR